MEPLITLVVVTLLARISGRYRFGGDRFATLAGALRLGVAAMFVLTGTVHFVGLREEFLKMVPPVLGDPGFWVTFTGIAELAGAVGLLLPGMRRAAAAGLLLLLFAVLPANVYAAAHHVPFDGRDATPLLPRLVEQFLYVAAVAWAGFGDFYRRVVPRPSSRSVATTGGASASRT